MFTQQLKDQLTGKFYSEINNSAEKQKVSFIKDTEESLIQLDELAKAKNIIKKRDKILKELAENSKIDPFLGNDLIHYSVILHSILESILLSKIDSIKSNAAPELFILIEPKEYESYFSNVYYFILRLIEKIRETERSYEKLKKVKDKSPLLEHLTQLSKEIKQVSQKFRLGYYDIISIKNHLMDLEFDSDLEKMFDELSSVFDIMIGEIKHAKSDENFLIWKDNSFRNARYNLVEFTVTIENIIAKLVREDVDSIYQFLFAIEEKEVIQSALLNHLKLDYLEEKIGGKKSPTSDSVEFNAEKFWENVGKKFEERFLKPKSGREKKWFSPKDGYDTYFFEVLSTKLRSAKLIDEQLTDLQFASIFSGKPVKKKANWIGKAPKAPMLYLMYLLLEKEKIVKYPPQFYPIIAACFLINNEAIRKDSNSQDGLRSYNKILKGKYPGKKTRTAIENIFKKTSEYYHRYK